MISQKPTIFTRKIIKSDKNVDLIKIEPFSYQKHQFKTAISKNIIRKIYLYELSYSHNIKLNFRVRIQTIFSKHKLDIFMF